MENLSDPENSTLSHHINQAIRAHGVIWRSFERCSLFSMDTVPTSTGCPLAWHSLICSRAGLTDEIIAEATGFAETDNQEILDARKLFLERMDKHKQDISGETDKVRQGRRARCW